MWSSTLLCAVFTWFVCFSSALVGTGARPSVRVHQGLVSGSYKTSAATKRTYASFEGIPYASPPVGKYRFREPQPLKPWVGVWDASEKGSPCVQYNPSEKDPDDRIYGSENCLFVNVYAPQFHAATALPVLVYIHGGAFMYGSSNLYHERLIMDRDIVLVTLNYRLGPLGFLSTNDDMVPGNMGLKDQAFALHWVNENIMMFGGDPNSVTIAGLSAGGASVHFQYLSLLSAGTFHRGFAMSGSALNPWTLTQRPERRARALAAHVGCPTAAAAGPAHSASRDMLDCLRRRPAEMIVRAQKIFFGWDMGQWFSAFTPVVEPMSARNAFITESPYTIAASGRSHRVPLLISITSEEGLYPAAAYQENPKFLQELEAKWMSWASEMFLYNSTLPVARRAEVAQKIKQHYLRGEAVSQHTFPELVQSLGDRLFVSGVGVAAQLHAAKSGQPVHVYRYSFRGGDSYSNLMAGDRNDYGVSHADDAFHILEIDGLDARKTPGDKEMTKILLDMVYAYCTTGVPTVPKVDWTPLDANAKQLKYLEFVSPTNIHMKTTGDFGHKSFWNGLGFNENEQAMLGMRDEL